MAGINTILSICLASTRYKHYCNDLFWKHRLEKKYNIVITEQYNYQFLNYFINDIALQNIFVKATDLYKKHQMKNICKYYNLLIIIIYVYLRI